MSIEQCMDLINDIQSCLEDIRSDLNIGELNDDLPFYEKLLTKVKFTIQRRDA